MAGGNGDLRTARRLLGSCNARRVCWFPGAMGSPFQCVASGRELTHLNQIKSSVCSFLHSVAMLPASPANCRLFSSFVALTGSDNELLPPPLCKVTEPHSQLLLRNQTSSGRYVEKHSWQYQKEFPSSGQTRFVPRCQPLDRPPANATRIADRYAPT